MKEKLPLGSDVFHLPCRSGYAQAGAPTKAVVHPKNPEGYSNRYKPDFRLKFVKKYFEESIPSSVLCKECGISDGTLYNWAKAYRREGVAGLESRAEGQPEAGYPCAGSGKNC
jgi:transposase-like protein